MSVVTKAKKMLAVGVMAAALGGCAQLPDNVGQTPTDPWEAVNRQTFVFNAAIDEATVRPLAKGYEKVVPDVVKDRIGSFFGNLMEPKNALNNALQGKGHETMVSLYRFLVNTTLGLGGLFDVADMAAGIRPAPEDFGQTLRVWGVPTGPYVVLPFLGPSTITDATGTVVGWYTEPLAYVDDDLVKWGSTGVYLVHERARIMPATDMLRDAVDPYVMTREGYLANRRSLQYDGEAPLDFVEDEFEDETK